MTNAIAEYNKTQVLTASGPQVIVLLYDAALQALRLAQDGIRRNHHPDKARFLGRAFRIVGELDNVLDMERGGEIARAPQADALLQAVQRRDPPGQAQVDQDHRQDGDHHHERQSRRLGVVALLQVERLDHVADHRGAGAAQDLGVHVVPHRGDERQQHPRDDPGGGDRQRHPQEGLCR